jgi:nucleotide-binding universal stress UspA family protein
VSIRKILAPIRGDGKGRFVLDHALAIADKLNAHVDVVYINSATDRMVPYGVPIGGKMQKTIQEIVDGYTTSEKERVRQKFDEYLDDRMIKESSKPTGSSDAASVSWHEDTGRQSHVVAARGLYSDLIVVHRPDPKNRVGINTLEEALFATGKPVLLVPRSSPTKLAEHVAIAWNNSAAVSRTVSMALPILRAAKKVTVICACHGDGEEFSVKTFAEYLRWHGLKPKVEVISTRARHTGAKLMAAAIDAGADMLVVGAYSHNRHKEILLGGVTQHVIWKMKMPILMAR